MRQRQAGSRDARVRALAGVVVAIGVGSAALAVWAIVDATHPKPPAQVVAGAFITPAPPPASPSASSSSPAPLPPRCRTTQLAMKVTSSPYNTDASLWVFELLDLGPRDCSLSGAPTISWPRGVEASLQGGLLTAPPANGGKGLSENQAYGHGTSQIGPVVLTPDGVAAAFVTVEFPGPGVKGIWACINRGQESEMPSWLYVTLPGATHSVAVPESVFAPGYPFCWAFGSTTAIYTATVLAEGMSWSNPALRAVPVSPIMLPPGTASGDLG